MGDSARKQQPERKVAVYNRLSGEWEPVGYQGRASKDLPSVLREIKVPESSQADDYSRRVRARVVVRSHGHWKEYEIVERLSGALRQADQQVVGWVQGPATLLKARIRTE